MYARTKQWELGDISVHVDYDNHSTPRRFEVTITLTGDVTEAQLERLQKVAASCPVRRSIEAGIEFHEHIDSVTVSQRDQPEALPREVAATAFVSERVPF